MVANTPLPPSSPLGRPRIKEYLRRTYISFYYIILRCKYNSAGAVRGHSEIIDNPATHVPFTCVCPRPRGIHHFCRRFMATGDSSSAKVVKTRYTVATPRSGLVICSGGRLPWKRLTPEWRLFLKQKRILYATGQGRTVRWRPLKYPSVKNRKWFIRYGALCVDTN